MSLLPSANTCCDPCDVVQTTAVPGPAGSDGAAGAAGADGASSFTTTSAQFTMPAEGANVTIDVVSSAGFAIGQIIYIYSGGSKGYFEVITKPSATQLEIQNLESTASSAYTINSVAGTIFASSATVVPAGLQGPAGSSASGAPDSATYIVQTAHASLSAEQALGALATGILKNTTTTGVLSIAVDGTDYLSPSTGLIPSNDLSDVDDAATARTNLGLAIGTNVQAYDATLQSISSLGTIADRYMYTTGVDTWAEGTITAQGRAILDDSAASDQRTTLGLNRAVNDLIVLEDQQILSTDGGAFTSGAWRTRTLNTEVVDTGSHCTLASNEFTLAAGTYIIEAEAPAHAVDSHQARLFNVTDASVECYGTSEHSISTDSVVTKSKIIWRVTIASAKAFRIEHRCETTKATDGFGLSTGFGGGTSEIYTRVVIRREAN